MTEQQKTKPTAKKNSQGTTAKSATAKEAVDKKLVAKKTATTVAAKKKSASLAEKKVAVSAVKKVTATPAAKAADKKTSSIKKEPKKATKASPVEVNLRPTPEERYRMIETAAYFIAERSNFQGDPAAFWSAAEIEIATLLGE